MSTDHQTSSSDHDAAYYDDYSARHKIYEQLMRSLGKFVRPACDNCIEAMRCGLIRAFTTQVSNRSTANASVHEPVALPGYGSPLFDINQVSTHSTTLPPDVVQLRYARRFYTAKKPTLLFTNPQFRLLPESHHPEVAFLGRSNVGKSSLLNALFDKPEMAHTSQKPGKTRLLNGYGVSPHSLSAAPKSGSKGEIMANAWRRMRGGLVVVDMPGYGAGSKAEWGKEIMKYLEQRRQLRRAFVLIDSQHGMKSSDHAILEHLFRHGIPHTIVLSKADKMLYPQAKPPNPPRLQAGIMLMQALITDIKAILKTEVWQGRDAASDFMCVSAQKSLDTLDPAPGKIGIDALRWATLCACGLHEEQRKKGLAVDDINIIDP